MFHAQDGLFFERLANGDVHIIVRESGRPDDAIVFETTITDGSWASITCSMSALGEDGTRWRDALTFHNETVR